MTVLEFGESRLTVEPSEGGRWTSLQVAGLELLSGGDDPWMPRGCFVMAPFAGRLREGRFGFDGHRFEVPANWGRHAIHGTVLHRPWELEPGEGLRLSCGLGDWPMPGTVRQELSLREGGLTARLVLTAHAPMPAVLGWHPWFARRLLRGGDLVLTVRPERQYVRDGEGLPTGELAPACPGPWDDCFLGLVGDPVLTWPGALELTVRADTDHWVVFDELPHTVCVEPQTGGPDLLRATRLEAGEQLSLELRLDWRQLPA